MRSALAFVVVALLALPALAFAVPAACPNLHDSSQLPSLASRLTAARAAGFELTAAAAPLTPDDVARFNLVGPPSLPDLPGSSVCTGKIRPGAPLLILKNGGGFLCSADFVFQDAQGAYYLGTAGHCIPGLDWTDIEIPGVGDIGNPVFRQAGGIGEDFGLIRIDPAKYAFVDPTMCHWGGPTSEPSPAPTPEALGPLFPTMEGVPLLQYGWGIFYNQNADTRARAGDLLLFDDGPGDSIAALPVAPGDSGSGAMTVLGTAAGIVTHTLILAPAGTPPIGDGLTFLTRVDHAEQMVHDATGLTIHVALSSHPVDPTGLLTP